MIKQYSEELVSKYSVFRPLEFRSIQCYEALLIHFIDVIPSLLENHNHSIVQNITSLCWSSISKYAAFSTPIFWGVRAVGGLCSSLFLNFSSHWKWKKNFRERKKWLPVAYNSYLIPKNNPPLRLGALWCILHSWRCQ